MLDRVMSGPSRIREAALFESCDFWEVLSDSEFALHKSSFRAFKKEIRKERRKRKKKKKRRIKVHPTMEEKETVKREERFLKKEKD